MIEIVFLSTIITGARNWPTTLPWPLRFASIVSLVLTTATGSLRAEKGEPLPGTKRLTIEQPLDEVMVSGIDKFALRELDDAPNRRALLWKRDYSSVEAYLKSKIKNRCHTAYSGKQFRSSSDRIPVHSFLFLH